MRLAHDGHAPSAFPFSRALSDPAAVTSFLPERAARRVAELHLRGPSGAVPAHILWPSPAESAPPIAVLCPGGRAIEHELCAAGLLVVNAYEATTVDALATVLEWVADHGVELGADPTRLIVAGAGTGADLAAAVARHARELGWPPIVHEVLVR